MNILLNLNIWAPKGDENLFELARFRVIEGNTSVIQAEGELQSVWVSERFELNRSRDIEVQL